MLRISADGSSPPVWAPWLRFNPLSILVLPQSVAEHRIAITFYQLRIKRPAGQYGRNPGLVINVDLQKGRR